mgnify:CR=1 FL=1
MSLNRGPEGVVPNKEKVIDKKDQDFHDPLEDKIDKRADSRTMDDAQQFRGDDSETRRPAYEDPNLKKAKKVQDKIPEPIDKQIHEPGISRDPYPERAFEPNE